MGRRCYGGTMEWVWALAVVCGSGVAVTIAALPFTRWALERFSPEHPAEAWEREARACAQIGMKAEREGKDKEATRHFVLANNAQKKAQYLRRGKVPPVWHNGKWEDL